MRAKWFHYGVPHGPWQQIEMQPCPEWRVVADERPFGQWDVRTVHASGQRVPPGPNLHHDPAPEMQRLAALLNVPLHGAA